MAFNTHRRGWNNETEKWLAVDKARFVDHPIDLGITPAAVRTACHLPATPRDPRCAQEADRSVAAGGNIRYRGKRLYVGKSMEAAIVHIVAGPDLIELDDHQGTQFSSIPWPPTTTGHKGINVTRPPLTAEPGRHQRAEPQCLPRGGRGPAQRHRRRQSARPRACAPRAPRLRRRLGMRGTPVSRWTASTTSATRCDITIGGGGDGQGHGLRRFGSVARPAHCRRAHPPGGRGHCLASGLSPTSTPPRAASGR